jgi:predicted nuclease with TOPRIM domain
MRTRVLGLVVCSVMALTGAARADEAEGKKLQEEVAALRDKLVKTEVEAKLLQDRNKQLEQRIQELEKELERLRKKDATPRAGGVNRPPENVEGLVKAVDEKSGLVTITLGSDAGLGGGTRSTSTASSRHRSTSGRLRLST